jgi:uncharacterized membrane protein YeaQ/YmgE (transglycosylase-associated protein family)
VVLLEFALLLLVAGVCGVVGQCLIRYSCGGCLFSVTLGFVGALLGMWLAWMVGIGEVFTINVGGRSFPIVWCFVGSALLVGLLTFFRRRRI